MQARRSAIALGLALALVSSESACADRTAIMVEVTSADLSIPTDIDSITIRAESRFGSTHERTYPVSASWPHSLTILPAAREGVAEVRIDVTGNRADRFVVRRVVLTEFVPGTLRRVSVVLSRACVGVVCDLGVDCLPPGMCVLPGPDGGVPDGGPTDGGASDAGPSDAGLDAPELDASIDAPMSFDTPVEIDTPIPIDVGMDTPPALDAGSDGGPPDGGPPDAPLPPSDAGPASILFSEYVEGSASNKAVEIFNGGTTPLDLSTCDVNLYSNGAVTATPYTGLSGTLAAGDVFVLCHGAADATLTPLCDLPLGPSGGALAFNGDDALELSCGGIRMDVLGQIGLDPGVEWGSSPTSTLNATLRRSCAVVRGDTNGADTFTPATEWTGSPIDTFSGLGTRGCP